MFRRLHLLHEVLRYVEQRLPLYGPPLHEDLRAFRDETIRATLGTGVGAAAGLIFGCFLSVALIVSAWDSRYRVIVAWMVCVGWAIMALAGWMYARRSVRGRPPFQQSASAFVRDFAHVRALIADMDDLEDQG